MISTYQIRNVLRVYGNDLKKRTMILRKNENEGESNQSPDSISISDEARKKEVLSKISNNIILEISKKDYHNK